MASNAIDQSPSLRPQPGESGVRVRQPVRVALWPIALLIYAALLPREVGFSVGGLIFYADRVGYILVLPYLIQKLMAGAIRFVLPDLLVLFVSMWMIISMSANYGIVLGLERGGSLAFDATVGYYLARISFRSLQDMRKVLILIAPGLFLAGFIVMMESVTHRLIVEPAAVQLFGRLNVTLGTDVRTEVNALSEIRMGLMRGKGPFAHSIHAGIFLASWLALYAMGGIRGLPRLMGIVAGLFGVFSLSSAALQVLVLSIFLIAYDRIQRSVRELNWSIMVIGGGGLLLLLNTVSNSGAANLVGRYLTFNPATSYFRQLIWQYGTQSVWKHPWTGIGFESYERPVWMYTQSIDAHWLLLAMRFGLPAAVAMFAATVLALFALSRASVNAIPGDQRFYRGIAISLFVMAVAMFTVALWGNLQSLFNILLGGCVACAQHSYMRVRIKL